MVFRWFVCCLLALLSSGLLIGRAQQPLPVIAPPSNAIDLDVVVNTKLGQPVTTLSQQDFTILDNRRPQSITSFKAMSDAQEPVRVIILLDAVNMYQDTVAYVRKGVSAFLKANGGKLNDPTALAVVNDDGVKFENSFSTDGNALADSLERIPIGLRQITQSSDWGATERMEISLRAFRQMLTYAAPLRGRKFILWISPGWPLISGPEVHLDTKDQLRTFDEVVHLLNLGRTGNLTFYNINPVGVGDTMFHANYFQNFLKGVVRPSDVQLGNLSIQVLSMQSGGFTFESSSDVAGLIRKSLIDAQSWYAITYDALPGEIPNEYHHIEVKLSRRDLVARTRDGYYANPRVLEPQR